MKANNRHRPSATPRDDADDNDELHALEPRSSQQAHAVDAEYDDGEEHDTNSDSSGAEDDTAEVVTVPRMGAAVSRSSAAVNQSGGVATTNDKSHSRVMPYGSLLEFWVACAAACVFNFLVALPAIALVRHRAVLWGSQLGCGLSFALIGSACGILTMTGTIFAQHTWAGAIPATIALALAPWLAYRGITGWTSLSNRSGSFIDVIVVAVLASVLIAVVLILMVRSLVDALMHSM